MFVSDLLGISFHNLLLHKIRSLLTSLGIIFGVGSVIAMLAISQGAKQESISHIEAMGIDNIIISTNEPTPSQQDEAQSGQNSIIKKFGLTHVDKNHIAGMDNVSRISTLRDTRKKVMRGTARLDVKLVAADIDFLRDSRSDILKGRWLSEVDNKNLSTVCVIGKNVKRKLFNLGAQNIIGRTLSFDGAAFRVVGILENVHGTSIGAMGSPNNMILIPERTSTAIFTYSAFQRDGRTQLKISEVEFDVFIVKVRDLASIDHTAKRIQAFLRTAHKKTHDWSIFVPYDLLLQKERTQNIFTIVMGSIAGISLLVGGVGIMNIMLANVYERRKEIGTCRAIGAKKHEILLQFLVETVFLTSFGGGVGILLGVGLSKVITFYAGWPIIFSPWIIILSFAIAAAVGIVFGTYPAWKAAQQNPIEVLRAE